MWERSLIRRVVEWRRSVLALIALVTIGAALLCMRLTFDTSIETWFLDDDPDLVAYEAFLDRFQADEVVIVAVMADDVFTPEVLGDIQRLTDAIEADAQYVHRVRSITNTDVYELQIVDGDKTIAIGPIAEHIPKTAEEATAIRARALANPLVVNNLVSADGTAAAIVVEIEAGADTMDQKIAFLDDVDAAVRDEVHTASVDVVGGAAMDRAFFDYSQQDFLILGPVAVLLILIAAVLIFGRLSAAAISLGVVICAALWMFAILVLLGEQLDMLSSGLVVLVMAVGIADTVHVLADYDRKVALLLKNSGVSGATSDVVDTTARHAMVVEATAELLVPCLFTSMTTAAGLLALTISDLQPLGRFGYMAAIGVSCAFVLSMTLVPCLLAMLPPPGRKYLEKNQSNRMARLLGFLGRQRRTTQLQIVAVGTVLVAVASWGVATLQIGSNPTEYFKPTDPIRVSMVRVDEALGGTTTVEFLVHAPNDGFRDLERLHRLDELENWAEDLPHVGHVDSPMDPLRELNRLWTDGKPASAVIPDTRPKVVQLFHTVENSDDFEASLQDDYQVGRVTARVPLSKAGELSRMMPEIEAHLAEHHQDDDLNVSATGFVKLMANMEHYLLYSQIQSLLLAMAIVTLMIMVLLRSFKLALFSMIPNVLPIIVGLGFMSFAGIALDPGTVMIGSVCLGLVVDDTVHYLVRLRRNMLHQPLADAVDHAMQETGRPIIVTSIILATSFLALGIAASFAPNMYFGLVASLVIVMAMIADLVLLPAALLLTARFKMAS